MKYYMYLTSVISFWLGLVKGVKFLYNFDSSDSQIFQQKKMDTNSTAESVAAFPNQCIIFLFMAVQP